MPCYTLKMKGGGHAILCGDLGPHCSDDKCGYWADNLCDYPMGDDKTCDRLICDDHSKEVAPNIHYCAEHAKKWDEFVSSGGVKNNLENVVPYKKDG